MEETGEKLRPQNLQGRHFRSGRQAPRRENARGAAAQVAVAD